MSEGGETVCLKSSEIEGVADSFRSAPVTPVCSGDESVFNWEEKEMNSGNIDLLSKDQKFFVPPSSEQDCNEVDSIKDQDKFSKKRKLFLSGIDEISKRIKSDVVTSASSLNNPRDLKSLSRDSSSTEDGVSRRSASPSNNQRQSFGVDSIIKEAVILKPQALRSNSTSNSSNERLQKLSAESQDNFGNS